MNNSLLHYLTILGLLLMNLNLRSQEQLLVEGDVRLEDGNPTITLYSTDDNRVESQLFSSNGNFFLNNRFGSILLRASDNGGFDTRLFIEGSNGNIGMGTDSPLSRLQVTDGNDLSLSTHGYLLLGSANGPNLVFDDNEIQSRNSGSASDLILQLEGGKIGIGDFQPEGKLTIRHNSTPGNPQLRLTETGTGLGRIEFRNTTNSNRYAFISSDPGADPATLGIGYNDGLDSKRFIDLRYTADLIRMQHESGSILLCGEENGAVGIGIALSTDMPEGYMLAVDGQIISEEVLVELSGGWPDYVFEEQYELMPIQELAKSLKINKHLPGLPSAQEIESKGGHDLGKTQRKLLEKIEELTLYIIELEERISQIENK
ncbi:MAG: hypothetical protein KDC53_24825 [Saprospiraceae bacterium]|nr:hypothetical protein [Saprospiraceae bacterium]